MAKKSSETPQSISENWHPRTFRENRFVYPVLSRRSGGVSIGINLNPDKACNFGCIYCQVDRSKVPQTQFVEMGPLLVELESVLKGLLPDGPLWSEAEFVDIPTTKRHVSDIAFSGDGEPTTFKNFAEVIQESVAIKERLGFCISQGRLDHQCDRF